MANVFLNSEIDHQKMIYLIKHELFIPYQFKHFFYISLFAICYALLAALGLELQSTQFGVSPFWPASGLSFAILFIFGLWLWPGILLGMFLIGAFINMPISIIVISGFGSILEAIIPIFILRAYQFSGRLDSFRDCLQFILAAAFAPFISAIFGSIAIYLFLDGMQLPTLTVLILWWLGNSIGFLLLGGLILSAHEGYIRHLFFKRLQEKLLFLIATIVLFIFTFTEKTEIESLILAQLLIPIIFISSIRLFAFGPMAVSFIFLLLISFSSEHILFNLQSSYPLGSFFLLIFEIWAISLSGLLTAGAFHDLINQKRITWLANHDPLTALYNRQFLENEITHILRGIRQTDQQITLMFIDLDHLKPINDNLGHKVGDRLLIDMARVLQKCTRYEDIIARWGGDEFVILFKHCPSDRLQLIADKILNETRQLSFKTEDAEFNISASIGVTQSLPKDTIKSFIERADSACYKAKHNGRDQVILD